MRDFARLAVFLELTPHLAVLSSTHGGCMPRKKKTSAETMQAIAEPEKPPPPKEPQEPPKTPDPDRNGPPEGIKAILKSRERKALDADRFDGRKPPMPWKDTVRSIDVRVDTGIKFVQTTSPDKIGLSFPEYDTATRGEQAYMWEAAGLKFDSEARSWLVDKIPKAYPEERIAQFDRVEAVHKRINEMRTKEIDEMARQ